MWMRNSQGLTKIFTDKSLYLDTQYCKAEQRYIDTGVNTSGDITKKSNTAFQCENLKDGLAHIQDDIPGRYSRTIFQDDLAYLQDDLTHLQDDIPGRLNISPGRYHTSPGRFSTSPRYGANSILQRWCLWARLQRVLADYNCDFMSSHHTCPSRCHQSVVTGVATLHRCRCRNNSTWRMAVNGSQSTTAGDSFYRSIYTTMSTNLSSAIPIAHPLTRS